MKKAAFFLAVLFTAALVFAQQDTVPDNRQLVARARTIYVESDTFYMKRENLESSLLGRPEPIVRIGGAFKFCGQDAGHCPDQLSGRIKNLQPDAHGEYVITLRDGVRLQSGRTYSNRLRALVNNPF